ncbi:acylphosphatase-2 isoform X3 [Peromyscus californicus insignis]|uniref:acylphosphatase-2 isoform X3 n=1 Tax=Peromyscus californicus insignis TaxID=564181 RepID=UPI0022A6A3B5|nr:acylphosphatase-2 isoform X3 [Peromyscus californicus insignis]
MLLPRNSCCVQAVSFDFLGGVCFRMYTEGEAKKRGVVGWVKNTSKGTVTGQVQGPEEKVDSITRRSTVSEPNYMLNASCKNSPGRVRFHDL